MAVLSVHERELPASAAEISPLIDGLASADDRLWPHDRWPAMKFDRPLDVGARGGHGPIRYQVESYDPGRSVRFRFTGENPVIQGHHGFEIQEVSEANCKLRHLIEGRVVGRNRLRWLLVLRPLHDALLRDALDRAERFAGGAPALRRWSLWVRTIRWAMIRVRTARHRKKTDGAIGKR